MWKERLEFLYLDIFIFGFQICFFFFFSLLSGRRRELAASDKAQVRECERRAVSAGLRSEGGFVLGWSITE